MPRNNVEKLSVKKEKEQPQNLTNLQSVLGFVSPTEHVELPSKGKFYSKDHPLCGVDTLEIKYLSAKELDILSSKSLLNKGVAVDRMLQSIIVDTSVKVEDLVVGDKNAVIIAARIGTFGEDYKVNLTCGTCESNFEHTFNLSHLEDLTPPVSDDVEFSENGTFFITLPKTKVRVECRLLTAKDEKWLEETAKKKHKMNLPESSLTDQYKSFIVSLNGVAERGLVDEFVDVMPAGDMHYLSKKYAEAKPDINMSQDCECTSCGAINVLDIPFTANFFWPE
jgi:hypothetical protein